MNKEGKNGCCGTDSKGKCCPITGIPFKCFGKLLIFGIITAIVSAAVGFAVWHKIFAAGVMSSDVAHLWRTMDAPEWKMIPFYHLIFGLCFAAAYLSLSPALTWCNGPSACKGMKFGIIISLIPAVAKTYIVYVTQPVNDSVVMAMFFDTFLSCLLAGAVLGFLQGKCPKSKAACGTEGAGTSCSTEKNHCGSKE